ncbi:MAG TPA: hypothetical protein PLG30_14935 [Bacteroidia bacterium]|nr:hypothetical protein [Bacteroidia bacterium]
MRKSFSLLFTLMVNLLLGQKNDNCWPLAYSYGIGSVYYYNMEFTNGYADTVSYQRKMKFFLGNASCTREAVLRGFCVWKFYFNHILI